MNPETPDCSLTSTAKARMPLGMFATSPGGDPLGPSFLSTIGSPSSMVVLTHRSSTSLNEENAPAGTAGLLVRTVLIMSGLRASSSLKSRAATRISCDSSSAAAGLLIRCRVASMAPRPRKTASTSTVSDLLFICSFHFPPDLGSCVFRSCCRPRALAIAACRSEEQPHPAEAGDGADRDRDTVRKEHHVFLTLASSFGQHGGVANRENLVADRLKHHPVADHIARGNNHRHAQQPAHQRRGHKCPERQPWAQPGSDAGHQLDVTRSHAADRIER